MTAVTETVPTTRSSAFSNGTDQMLSNTAVLNAGGNIIYLEWNPQSNYRPSVPGSPQANVDTSVDSFFLGLDGTLESQEGVDVLQSRECSTDEISVSMISSHKPKFRPSES
ncbi:hypothetical protein BDQ17DRAFT_1337690 [Cyathus striatus]|nr:hypothetical protein BDQ17DRAFT_1337690 [Cyathus striatus]